MYDICRWLRRKKVVWGRWPIHGRGVWPVDGVVIEDALLWFIGWRIPPLLDFPSNQHRFRIPPPNDFLDYKHMYIGLHAKCLLLLSDFNQIGVHRRILVKFATIKFNQNPFSRSQVVSFTPRCFYSKNVSPSANWIGRRVIGLQGQCGRGGEGRNQCRWLESNPGHSECSLITILT
jgi:hypothetical protein